jgi:hypothetical protein
MRKIFLFALLHLSISFLFAQEKPFVNLKEMSNAGLRSAQAIISNFAHKYYLLSNGILWQQEVHINEAQGIIECKARPAADSSKNEWNTIQRIPLLRVDSIYHTAADSTVTFISNYPFAENYSLGTVSHRLYFTFHAKIWSIRNISWQIWNHLNEYKQQKLKELTARETIKESVLDYLLKHQYNVLLTQKLLSNNKLYVGKCNICNGTKDALSSFSKAMIDIKWKIMDDLSDSLNIENHEVQMSALESLVNRSINAFYIVHNFSKEQIIKSQALLTAEKKKSMGIAAGKKCASCDGACTL